MTSLNSKARLSGGNLGVTLCGEMPSVLLLNGQAVAAQQS